MRRLWSAAALAVALGHAASAWAQHSDEGGPFAHHTFLFSHPDYVIQIEYLDGEGGAYLWYPGESAVILGSWRVSDEEEICFVYDAAPSAALDGPPAGEWACQPLEEHWPEIREKRAGDPFDLQSGAVPFVLRFDDDFRSFEAVLGAMR